MVERVAVAHRLLLPADGPLPVAEIEALPWSVERPKQGTRGDLATNVALVLAKHLGKPPRDIASAICEEIVEAQGIAHCEVAGPGFINMTLAKEYFHDELKEILAAGAGWGRKPSGTGERINLEFVSANPTGPVTVASGRNAVIGDALGRLLESQGHRVTREYYINDRGKQIAQFTKSVFAHQVPGAYTSDQVEYHGAYVSELASWFTHNELLDGLSEQVQGRKCVNRMLRGIPGSETLPGIRPSLAALGVNFDVWFSETSLYESGLFNDTLDRLVVAGLVETKNGAMFFKTDASQQGERVLQKTDGEWTYFASDTSYCADKIARGYERLILVVGADHHGYVPCIRDALKVLSFKGTFDVLLYQLVTIIKDGQPVRMSKRAGNIITIDEVMDEIDESAGHKGAGSDAIRFLFLMRSSNTTFEFDVTQASKRSMDNPVFYVQYGYARLCSILRRAEELGFEQNTRSIEAIVVASELALIQRLGDYPEVLEKATKLMEPHRVANYLYDLARDFHSYYTETRKDPILPRAADVAQHPNWREGWDVRQTEGRLAWIEAIRLVYRSALDILGVSAPERMDQRDEILAEKVFGAFDQHIQTPPELEAKLMAKIEEGK